MTARRVGALLAAVLVAGCSAGTAAAPVPSGPPVSDLRVGLLEYEFALSAGSVRPGPVTVAVTNAGSTGHDVRFYQGEDEIGIVRELAPGEREQVRLDVRSGDPLRLDCTVRGHLQAGMTVRLAVTGG